MNNQSNSHSYLPAMSRRAFLRSAVTGLASLSLPLSSFAVGVPLPATDKGKPVYRGPRVILVRFGGGVRRQETIDPTHTFSPFLCHELINRGVLFKNMEVSVQDEVETNHRQGTLNLLTGKYDRSKDISYKVAGQRFEAQVPTLFEYLRKQYAVPTHQTLIIRGEDRTNEEFYSFSNHHLFGAPYGSSVLSLSHYKTYVLRQQLENNIWAAEEQEKREKEFAQVAALGYCPQGTEVHDKNIDRFWERWRHYYGESGLLNPHGDRLLTALAVHALHELRPTLLMIQYNDPDYVHWGNRNHYTQGIAIIDEGLQQLVIAAQADEEYRHNTIFVIVPDCGRDDNPFVAVPYQHHCNSRSAREIFALFFGPGIAKGVTIDRQVEQISVAATIGQLMGFPTNYAEGPVLAEVMA